MINNYEPEQIRIGETVKWNKSLSYFLPDDGWELNYKLYNAAVNIFDTLTFGSEITASNNEFNVVIPALTTAGWTAQTAIFEGYVEKGGEVFTVSEGFFKIFSVNPIASQILTVETTISNIEAVLTNKASEDVKKYEIKGRSLEKWSPVDLLKMLDYYKAELKRLQNELNLSKGIPNKQIRIRFNS